MNSFYSAMLNGKFERLFNKICSMVDDLDDVEPDNPTEASQIVDAAAHAAEAAVAIYDRLTR